MSSNPVHGEVCSMQHYVIKFVSDLLWQVGDSHQVSSTNETARHDIAEILLTVAINTTNQTMLIINSSKPCNYY